MTIKQILIQEIESASNTILLQTLDYLRFLKTKNNPDKATSSTPINSTGKSLFKHLKTIGSWEGDDLEECLQEVISSRGQAKFDYELNPFD